MKFASTSFMWSELACKCGCGNIFIQDAAIDKLQKTRDIVKVPLIININTDNSKYVVNEKVSSFNIKELIGKFLNKEINNHDDIKTFFSNSDFIPTTNLNEDLLMKRRFYNQK